MRQLVSHRCRQPLYQLLVSHGLLAWVASPMFVPIEMSDTVASFCGVKSEFEVRPFRDKRGGDYSAHVQAEVAEISGPSLSLHSTTVFPIYPWSRVSGCAQQRDLLHVASE